MPGKNNKPPRVRKRPAASASAAAEQQDNHHGNDGHHQPMHHAHSSRSRSPVAASRLPESLQNVSPIYRDDGSGAPPGMMGYPGGSSPLQQQQHQQQQNMLGNVNGMGSSPGPYPFPVARKPIVENGYTHSSPTPSPQAGERDPYSKMLEYNAHVILQINQAMMDNRPDVVGELMPLLAKNISYLNSCADQDPGSTHMVSRVSQSPLPVRPISQGTPPHISPPPMHQQQNVPNGSQFPQQPQQSTSYPSYGAPQAQQRPQPVYSPLTQSTQHFNQPRSPNLPFQQQQQQQQQQPSNGFGRQPPVFQNQPPVGYIQGMPMASPQHQQNLPQQQQQQQQHPQQSGSMPPPQNYPYAQAQSRGSAVPNYGSAGYGGGYQPHESMDPNFTSMPPPQMQPRSRQMPTGYRPNMPQNSTQDQQRQMAYQSRPFLDNYQQPQQQQQQQQLHYPGQMQQQQSNIPGPSTSYPSSVPPGQYLMQQPEHTFRTPALPMGAAPASGSLPFGSNPSSGGPGSS